MSAQRTNSERVGPGPYELRAQADHIEGSGYPLAGTAQLLREVADYVEGLRADVNERKAENERLRGCLKEYAGLKQRICAAGGSTDLEEAVAYLEGMA